MTLEELTKQVEDLKKELTTERKKVSDQNSYITKLEQQAKQTTPTATSNVNSADPTIQAYIEKKMREDILGQAVTQIKQEFTEAEYKAIEPDFMNFLDKNMKKENVRLEYILDAFALIMGRALRNKEHEIHKVKTVTPGGTTTEQNLNKVVQSVIPQPPVMTGKDGGGTPPPSTEQKIGSTKDAFTALKQKMGTIGGNRFS